MINNFADINAKMINLNDYEEFFFSDHIEHPKSQGQPYFHY